MKTENGERWWGYSDILCIISCVAVLGMSVVSYVESMRGGYQVNTGVFCGLFVLIPVLLRYFRVVRLPNIFVVAILVAVLLHAYGVLLLSYDLLPYYDTVTHFLSSTVVALCVFYTLMCYQAYGGKCKFEGRGLFLAIALIMMGFSAYWEVFEFAVDAITGTTMQYSPFDTLRDMVCNTLGSLLVSFAVTYYMRDKSPRDIADSFELHRYLKAFIVDPFREKQHGNE